MEERGYVEGREPGDRLSSAEGRAERFDRAGRPSWSASKVDLIVTRGTPATLAAKACHLRDPDVMIARWPTRSKAGWSRASRARRQRHRRHQCHRRAGARSASSSLKRAGAEDDARRGVMRTSTTCGLRPAPGARAARRAPWASTHQRCSMCEAPTRASAPAFGQASAQPRRRAARSSIRDAGASQPRFADRRSCATGIALLGHVLGAPIRRRRRARWPTASYSLELYYRAAGYVAPHPQGRAARRAADRAAEQASSWFINRRTANVLGVIIPPDSLTRTPRGRGRHRLAGNNGHCYASPRIPAKETSMEMKMVKELLLQVAGARDGRRESLRNRAEMRTERGPEGRVGEVPRGNREARAGFTRRCACR